MGKRFADTALTREAWYRRLTPENKAAWRFLCDECDESGVWSIDEDSIEFHVGASIDLISFVDEVNNGKERVRRIGDKLLLVDFIKFQYGELSESCNPHKNSIKRLKKHGLWQWYLGTLPKEGYQGRELEKEKDKEEEKETEEGECEGKQTPPTPISNPISPGELSACKDEWRTTLKHFEIDRPLSSRDEIALARAIQSFGAEWVKLALMGARKQTKGKNFDPKHFVSLSIYLHKDRIERLVNIGSGKETSTGLDWSFIAGSKSA